MNLLYALLLSKVINPKKSKSNMRALKKDVKFIVQIITELVDLLNTIVEVIFKGTSTIIKKYFCNTKVAEVKNEKIINLDQYKLKKAK